MANLFQAGLPGPGAKLASPSTAGENVIGSRAIRRAEGIEGPPRPTTQPVTPVPNNQAIRIVNNAPEVPKPTGGAQALISANIADALPQPDASNQSQGGQAQTLKSHQGGQGQPVDPHSGDGNPQPVPPATRPSGGQGGQGGSSGLLTIALIGGLAFFVGRQALGDNQDG